MTEALINTRDLSLSLGEKDYSRCLLNRSPLLSGKFQSLKSLDCMCPESTVGKP